MTILKNLFEKRKIALAVLFLLLFFQLFFSFIYPSCPRPGTGHSWLSLPELISHKQSSLGSSDISIINKIAPFFSKYNVNADGGVYILLAEDFPQYFFKNPIYLGLPLYSFLVSSAAFLPRLIFDSFATVFASAIFLNFILAFGVILLLYLLVEKLISSRVAFLSCFLYIFSPLVHCGLPQPTAETYGAFIMMASIYMLYSYIKNPSHLKLIVFSLIIGIFMLGKMFFAISIFILLLALYFKRYKEGALFLAIHLIPLAFWYFWVTQVFGLEYYSNEAEFGAVVWLLKIFSWPWHQTAQAFLNVIPRFVSAVIYGFLLLPVIFALIGFKKLLLKNKEIFCLGLILSFLALFFISNFYEPRHAFYLFPMIYPLAILGIDRTADFLKRYKNWYGLIFYLIVFILLLVISNADIHKILVC